MSYHFQKHSTNKSLLQRQTKLQTILLLFAKICYISKLLAVVDLSNSEFKTYSKPTHSIKEIIQENINYCKKFDLNTEKIDQSLTIMYGLPKIHKTPFGNRFIVTLKSCATKPLSDAISRIFKMIFNTVESFHNKSFFIQIVRNSGLYKILFQLSLS